METETYEDAIKILMSGAQQIIDKGGETAQLASDALLASAKYLKHRREEIEQEKSAATLPDEGNK